MSRLIINTPIFGEIEIEDEKIISFEKGIPGFPEEKQFVFLPLPETPFTIMQSVGQELYFFLVNPFEFFETYEFEIPDSIVEFLDIKNTNDVLVYSIAKLHEDLAQTTANLQAPLVINISSQKGKQVVLNHSGYTIKQSLFQRKTIPASTE